MAHSNILVIYYSRSGLTAEVADAIARALGADQERIEDTVKREGFWGFLRSLRDTFRGNASPIHALKHDPAAYDLVIVGTPDWGRAVAAPARAFLAGQKGRLKNVAFFLTDGTRDHALVFQEMMELVGQAPVATLGISHTEVSADRYQPLVEAFVARLPRPIPIRSVG